MDRHIPAIDGMRAVCVGAVLLYHGQVGAKGAFLGISQFMTLSGFLVMSILLRQTADGATLSFRSFWGRRYRRLLPASLLTLAGVLVFAVTIGTEQQIDDLRRSIPAAVLQVANWHFITSDTSYVDLFQSPSPIQHFWSLAVEEQFYLFAPILLVGVLRVTRSSTAVVAVFAIGAVASTAWMWVLFDRGVSIDRLYYGTDTRAAELLAGCVLAAVLHHRRPELGRRSRAVLGWSTAGVYAVTVWCLFAVSLTDARMYRGGFLLYALATCLVIYGLVENVGPWRRVLEVSPVAAFGRISYGVYLYHWPLMLTLTPDRTGLDGWTLFGLQASTTTLVAAASARWFENPIRRGRAAPGDLRYPLAIAGAGLFVVAGSVALGSIDRQTELAGLGATAGPQPVVEVDSLRLLVVSDPRARAQAGEFEAAEGVDAVSVVPFSCGGTDDLVCPDWSQWARIASDDDVDVVVLDVTEWGGDGGPDDTAPDAVVSRMRTVIDELAAAGVPVIWRPTFTAADTVDDPNSILPAMQRVAASTPSLRRVPTNAPTDSIVTVARRLAGAEATGPRVMLVGDSVSLTIGYGLERWADERGGVVVWSAGTEGCGLARGGTFVDSSGREELPPAECETVAERWDDQLASFDPELVVVASNVVDFRARRFNDGALVAPGDPTFDDWLVGQYVDTVDRLTASGAAVRWIVPACGVDAFGVFDEPGGGGPLDPDRIDHVRDVVIPRLVEQRTDVELFDLGAVVCPGGDAIGEVEGVGVIRPDGIHFGTEGSQWLADNHATRILEVPGAEIAAQPSPNVER